MARYQICLGKSQLSDTFQLVINTYITTKFRLRTKKALDFFFPLKEGFSWGKKGKERKKKKRLTLFFSNRQIRKSEMEVVVWRKRKPHSLEAYASQCMVYYPA